MPFEIRPPKDQILKQRQTADQWVASASDGFLLRFVNIWLVFAIALWVFQVTTMPNIQYPSAVMFATGISARWALHYGRIDLARRLFLYPLCIAVLVIPLFVNGVRTPVIASMPMLILLAGWMLGRRTMLMITSMFVVSLILMFYAESHEWMAFNRELRGPIVWTMVWVSIAVLACTITWSFVANYESNFTTERSLRQQLEGALGRTEDMNRELSDALQFSQMVILNSPLPMGVYAADGRCVIVNEAYAKLAGAKIEDLLSQNFRQIEAWQRSSLLQDCLAALEERRPKAREVHIKISSGKEVWGDCRILPMQLKGESHLLMQFFDLTERMRAEAVVLEAKRAAEAANLAKSDFLSNMSHEIRTPLNAILGLTQLVLESDLTAKQFSYLQKVHGSSQALLGILNDILDYSKIEAGKLELERRDFDIEKVLENASALFSTQAAQKGVELFIDLAADVTAEVCGDSLRLSQIVNNLIGNAIKFTEHGEIEVQVRALPSPDGQVDLECLVSDTGVGISPEQIAQLFRAFAQADTSVTRKYGGTGLGLAISRHLVEMMDGSISVDSSLGQGSVFRFNVRLGLVGGGADQEVFKKRDVHGIAGSRILLVGSRPTSIRIVRAQLDAWNALVETADCGEAALQLIKESAAEGAPFDLLIADWKLSDMGGLDLASALREQTSGSKANYLPAIVMAHDFEREQRQMETEAAGAPIVLAKPVMPSRLAESIAVACRPEMAKDRAHAVQSSSYRDCAVVIQGARLLLVEDNALNRLVANELLTSAGFLVEIAEDGLQAVQMAENSSYDAILMDVQMPVMDGLEATRRLRMMERHRNTPILAMTAGAMLQDREASLAAGMNDHVAKPFDFGQLIDTLLKWVPAGR